MARTRSIKHSFFTHTGLAKRSPLARLVFESLWCLADREGRLKDDPDFIKINSIPWDDASVEELLNELATARPSEDHPFIIRYRVGHRRFIQVVNFLDHQSPHPKEAPSTIPPPPEVLLCDAGESRGISVAQPGISETKHSGSGILDPGSSGADGMVDPPADGSAELSEPVSPWGPSKPSTPPTVGEITWLRAIYRREFEARFGRTPSMGSGDRKTWERFLADNPDRAFQALLFEEMPQIVRAYLADPDGTLKEKGWPLAFLPERIERYRVRASPPPRTPAFDRAKISAQR